MNRSPVPLVHLTAVAALALFAGIAWYLAPLEPNILVLQFAFTPESFARVVHAWPDAHLQRYRAHLPIDGLLLLAYGAWGWLVASRTGLLHALPAALRRGARWCLPLAAVFDAAENALHWWLTAAPRFGVTLPYSFAASCAVIKWSLVFAFGALVVYAQARAEG